MMNEIYISIAKTVKSIQAEGFDFEEALAIFKAGPKISCDEKSDFGFFDSLFEISDERLNATEAYKFYLQSTSGEPISQTKFGRIISKFATKKKMNGGIYYQMRIKH